MIGTALKWLGGIALCLVLQTTIIRVIAIFGITPDLLILILFLLALRAGVMPALFAGFLIGLGQDLYTPAILGQHALAMTVTGAFLGLFNERVMRTDPLVKLVILLVAFFMHDIIFTVVTMVKIQAGMGMFAREMFLHTLPRAAYSIAFVMLLFIYSTFVKPTLRR